MANIGLLVLVWGGVGYAFRLPIYTRVYGPSV